MTISSTNRKAGPFIGNDSASVFPFTFSVFSAADVYAVQLNTVTSVESPLALGTDYTVTLNADQSANPGGTLTLTAGPLATGLTLTLTTAVTPLQLTDLTNQGGFYPRVITRAFDKLTVLVQQILERLGRSLTLPLSTPANVSTALPVPEANKALVWNSTATGLANYDASQFATSVIGTNRVVDRFLANGTAGPYVLSADPLNINNTLVFVGGDYRAHNSYTISGASITFGTTVANGTVVEVVQQLAVTYPVTALSDNVVSTGKVVDGAITLTKLAAAVQNLVNGALQKSGGDMTGLFKLAGNATHPLHPVPLQQLGTISAQCRTGFLMTASGSDATVVVSARELLLRDASGNPKLVSGASGTINLSGTIGQPLAISTGSWSADTWYAVWAWNNGTTTTFTADPSSSSPTAPAGYTSGYRQFLGGFRTDSTVNKRPLAFFDDGESCRYVVGTNLTGLPQMASGVAGSISSPTWVPVAWANFAPPWAKDIHVTAHQLASSGSVVMVASSNAFGAYTSATNPPPQVCAGGASVETVTTMEHPLESSNIYWASAGASGNGIFCRGWRSSL